MCRNIKLLFNFEPPATDAEITDAALQFVRKVSGTTKPLQLNQAAFDKAITEIGESVTNLLESLVTNTFPKNREVQAAQARQRSARRFGRDQTAESG